MAQSAGAKFVRRIEVCRDKLTDVSSITLSDKSMQKEDVQRLPNQRREGCNKRIVDVEWRCNKE